MNNAVDKQLGYLERATEEHTKDIDSLYDLVSRHMEKEEVTIRNINQKLTLLGILMILAVGKDLPWSALLQLL